MGCAEKKTCNPPAINVKFPQCRQPPILDNPVWSKRRFARPTWRCFRRRTRIIRRKIFNWATACFEGRYLDYQPIDAIYHDLEHTLQGALCMSQLLWNRQRAGAEPRLTRRMFELGMLAILMHDTGYLKKEGGHRRHRRQIHPDPCGPQHPVCRRTDARARLPGWRTFWRCRT